MATKIANVNCELSSAKEIDGMNFEIFAGTDDGRAVLRVTDIDSGMVSTLTVYPNMEMVKSEVAKVAAIDAGSNGGSIPL